jgi:pimeloyl-ACP methyl ester carboxylesterase
MAGEASTWDPVLPRLGRTCQAVAVDLLGHGRSDKPRDGDYSLGAYASQIRDLMAALGHDHATVVGHSLGGGVALQFAYQFPELCERMALVGAGGLGREVSPWLRAATLPGSEIVLQAMVAAKLPQAGMAVGRALRRVGLRPGADVENTWRSICSFQRADTRASFLKTVRSVVALDGQRVSAIDRLYLAAELPTLIVWGERDPIIPVAHAHAAHEAIAGSRLEVIPDSGHYPHRDHPMEFAEALDDFVHSTEGARLSADRWRTLLLAAGEPDLVEEAAAGG